MSVLKENQRRKAVEEKIAKKKEESFNEDAIDILLMSFYQSLVSVGPIEDDEEESVQKESGQEENGERDKMNLLPVL